MKIKCSTVLIENMFSDFLVPFMSDKDSLVASTCGPEGSLAQRNYQCYAALLMGNLEGSYWHYLDLPSLC